MRQLQVLCFNDYVLGATPVYSASTFNDVLGRYSTWVFQVVVTKVGGISPRITMWLEHSADARLWKEKGGMPTVSSETINANTTNVFVGADLSGIPSLDYVRLKINLEGTGPRAMVSVWACARGKTPPRQPSTSASLLCVVVTQQGRRAQVWPLGQVTNPRAFVNQADQAAPVADRNSELCIVRFLPDRPPERLVVGKETLPQPRSFR